LGMLGVLDGGEGKGGQTGKRDPEKKPSFSKKKAPFVESKGKRRPIFGRKRRDGA